MKKIKFALSMAAVLVLWMTTSSAAQAQATRTWVSGVGDDVNPCSRTAPCKTFAGAISKTAAGGEIDVIDPGGFGAVTITKAITIDGGGTFSSILAAGVNGIVVNAGATDVVRIRNVSINGVNQDPAVAPGLNGIRFIAGGELHVEGVAIFGFSQIGIDFEPAGNAKLMISQSYIENNNGGGVLIRPGAVGSAKATINELELYRNLFGLRADDRSTVGIFDSIASNNTNNGFLAFSSAQTSSMNIESSLAASNGAAGVSSVGSFTTISISNVTTVHNANGLSATSGGSIVSFGNNRNIGNTTNGAPTSTVPQQ